MINIVLAWREHIFFPERVGLATDLDASIIEVIQQWVVQNLNKMDPPLNIERMLSLVGSLVQHVARSGTIKALYTNKDYSEFAAVRNEFKNDPPFETIYIDIDSDNGVYFAIGVFDHYGPKTTGDGFLSYDPNSFRRNVPVTAPVEEFVPFEDVLDIME